MSTSPRRALTGGSQLAALLAFGAPAAAQFADNTTDIPSGAPFNAGRTENVDFADVDLDGDWDAAFAQGGDSQQDQNRIWINLGGAQGGTTGSFADETAARFPAWLDQSRDIEFADIDADGDPDIYTSNTSAIAHQSNRWWINLGGVQGGQAGYYEDDTANRWLGLDEAPTSIPASLILPQGGFIDWSCDCDFGDLDNDGDLDLVHTSYGGVFGGDVPTRLFLNDGAGFFREHNPSGYRLPQIDIANGAPGLWCEGVQKHFTMDFGGTFCDIATDGLDTDVGDIDGDFDLDLLMGSRDALPRMFASRLDGSGLAPATADGTLLFRDVTGLVFPPGYAPGNGHYEQEMGDMDRDGDLDIIGVNWHDVLGLGQSDKTLENVGGGIFANEVILANSYEDDTEFDFIDYDNDGDLDLISANFDGRDKLYRNDHEGGTGFSYTWVTALIPPTSNLIALDVEVADLDGDGDYDAIVANDAGQRQVYLENLNGTPDASPPYLPAIEQASSRAPDAEVPTVVRAHVYDNAPYYITWYNPTWLEVSVEGGAVQSFPMRSSGGQVFRGEIPGDHGGRVEYRAVSRDEHGNEGASAWRVYYGCSLESYCSSTPNSTGQAAQISSNGNCEVAANGLVLRAAPVPNQPGIFFYSSGRTNGGAGIPFGNGLRCVGSAADPIHRLPVTIAQGNVLTKSVDLTSPPGAAGQIDPGTTWHFQAWFRDPAGGGAAFDLSDALTIEFR